MAKKFKIPIKEATGEKNLEGSYLISFKLKDISVEDNIIISDIIEGLARGFEQSTALHKISQIDLEKTDASGTPLSQKPLKVGDFVSLNKDIVIKTQIAKEKDYYVVGSRTATKKVADVELRLPADSHAVINSLKEETVELIDFNSAIAVSLIDPETNEPEDVWINIDAVTIKKEDLDKIGE